MLESTSVHPSPADDPRYQPYLNEAATWRREPAVWADTYKREAIGRKVPGGTLGRDAPASGQQIHPRAFLVITQLTVIAAKAVVKPFMMRVCCVTASFQSPYRSKTSCVVVRESNGGGRDECYETEMWSGCGCGACVRIDGSSLFQRHSCDQGIPSVKIRWPYRHTTSFSFVQFVCRNSC